MVVLESERSMRARGVTPLAELRSGAYLCDGSHMSQPQSKSMAETMRMALERADLSAKQIDYINAHATATILGDIEETEATAAVFGAQVPVSSLKGNLGHTLAACGALDLIASVKMIEQGVLIPTRNLEHVDPRCASILHVRERKEVAVRAILSNNFAFGGMNTSLIVSGGA
jgi:3-oxoacyl-[acyl-carrier-protein] synthase II